MRPESLAGDVRQWLVSNAAPADAPSVRTALRDSGAVVGVAQFLDVLAELRAELQGAGPLQELLAAGSCTDVLVNGATSVWVDDGDGLRSIGNPFRDEAGVRRLAQRLAVAADRRLDDASPFCDARLADGTRFHAALGSVASPGTLVSLRLPRRGGFTIEELVEGRTIAADGARWLRALIGARATFLVSGGTGTGKTTVLSAMLQLVPATERIVILEDAPELRPNHPHVCCLEGRPSNIEGRGGLQLSDLMRQALRMRPDRLVVGEVRGPEVVDMLSAFNTGHDGGAGTVHAGDAARVPARIEALAAAAGLDRAAAHAQLAAGIDAIVHLDRYGSRRRIAALAELRRGDAGWSTAVDVLRFGDGATEVLDGASPLVRRLAAHL